MAPDWCSIFYRKIRNPFLFQRQPTLHCIIGPHRTSRQEAFKMMKQLLLLSLIVLISPVTSEKPHFRDDAADKVSWKFKNTPRKGTDVSVVVLNWEPSSMIENTGAISKEDFGVEIKAGVDGEFTTVEQEPRLKGGKYSYEINIVPCLEQFIRFVAKNSEGSTYFEHPETIPASSSEDISKSSYNLLSIEDGTLEKTGDLLTFTWSPSDCASSYLVTLQGNEELVEHETTETRLEMSLQELTEECGQYDVSVISVRDEKFSSAHFVTSLLTAPSESAVDELEVKVFPRAQSVMARWWGFKSMPCVSKYSVSLCKEDEACQESVSLTLDDSLAYVEYSSEETLAECSQYSLRIKPEYEGTDLQEKTVGFQTLSPGLAEVTAVMTPITAELRPDQQVQVSWPQVNCAAHYKLYQQAVTDTNPSHDWDFVTETTDTTATIPGVPCTEYIYGVRVVIDGEESEIVKMDQPIITSLDKSKPYTAPGLTVETSTSSVDLSWDHATCVQSYRVQLCPGEEECLEEVITTTSPQVTLTLDTLSPCTDYTVSIFARTDDQEIAEAAISNFQTDAPIPEAPEDFSLVEDPVQKTLTLSFSGQKCATQYKVYEVLDQEEPSERVIDLNHLTVEIPPPCTEYK